MIMKKLLIWTLIAAMALSLAACGSTTNKTDGTTQTLAEDTTAEGTEAIAGGWTLPDSPVLTEEQLTLLANAMETLDAVEYVPVAYLGSQVVAGMNHAFLCRVSPVVQDNVETYCVVYVYEDLDGNVELTSILDSGNPTNLNDEEYDGGWDETESPVLTEESKAALEQALSTITGTTYTPVALVSTQVVEGTNYCFLCLGTDSVPGGESRYTLVYVYQPLEGDAEVTDQKAFEDDYLLDYSQIPEPYVVYGSKGEAAADLGFDLSVPDTVEDYGEPTFAVVDGSILQATYQKGESLLNVRKEAAEGDISGDYTQYSQTRTVTVGEYEVTMKGENDMVSTAFWNHESFAYAVICDEPISVETMTALIEQIK